MWFSGLVGNPYREKSKMYLIPRITLHNFEPWIMTPMLHNPFSMGLLKVSNRNTRTRCGICSNITIKRPERRHWRRSDVFIVNFEHVIAGWENPSKSAFWTLDNIKNWTCRTFQRMLWMKRNISTHYYFTKALWKEHFFKNHCGMEQIQSLVLKIYFTLTDATNS